MTTYSWASQTLVAPTSQEIELAGNDAVLPSAFTGAIQTVSRPKLWRMSCTWQNIYGGERADLLAFFLRLNGVEHRVRMPFFGQVQRGSLGGTPLVNGASQTGHTVVIDGATPSQTGWAKAGDIFRLTTSNTIHMLTTDSNSDGSGNVTLNIIPELRTPTVNNDPLITTNTITGVWILESPVRMITSAMSRRSSGDQLQNDLTLTFIDDLVND